MRKFKGLIITSLLCFTLAGCRGETQFGECIGLNDTEHPNLNYEFSTRNAVVTAFFMPSIVIPVAWALEFAKCPTGLATQQTNQ